MPVGRHAASSWLRAGRVLIAASFLAGVSLLLYTGYLVLDPFAAQRQQQEARILQRQWQNTRAPQSSDAAMPRLRVKTGQPFAFIRIPRLGRHWRFTIVEGASLTQLATGPGHVTGTQLPGQPGNFAVAAHDITAGNPFLHLKELRRGNVVIVTTKFATYRYRVRSEKVVSYTDTAVLDPVPGKPGEQPRQSLITLITCTPVTLAFTPYRVIVTGVLVSTTRRQAEPALGRPVSSFLRAALLTHRP
ncbi:MAG TPA: class E sortase [Streptosporangiaceae bacterium]